MSDTPFDALQTRALAGVLDTLVPPSADGHLPGAGELGLAPGVAGKLGGAHTAIAKGLGALDAAAREIGAADFASLGAAARETLLRDYDRGDPGFVPGLVFHTYSAYYENERVMAAIGLEPRPPYPLGYSLEQPDLDALVAKVRGGPKRYREV